MKENFDPLSLLNEVLTRITISLMKIWFKGKYEIIALMKIPLNILRFFE